MTAGALVFSAGTLRAQDGPDLTIRLEHGSEAEAVEVRCVTCHRGLARQPVRRPPRPLVTVSIENLSDRITLDLEIRNRDTRRRDVLWGPGCNPTIEVYDMARETADRIVWNERQWRESAGGCIPVSRNSTLIPGGAVGSRHEIADGDVLGDSLAAGVYRVVVAFTMSQPEAALDLEAGTVRIGRP